MGGRSPTYASFMLLEDLGNRYLPVNTAILDLKEIHAVLFWYCIDYSMCPFLFAQTLCLRSDFVSTLRPLWNHLWSKRDVVDENRVLRQNKSLGQKFCLFCYNWKDSVVIQLHVQLCAVTLVATGRFPHTGCDKAIYFNLFSAAFPQQLGLYQVILPYSQEMRLWLLDDTKNQFVYSDCTLFWGKNGLVNQVKFVGLAGPFWTIALAMFKTVSDTPTQKCVK